MNQKDSAPDERHLAEPAPTTHGGRVELRLLPASGEGTGSVTYQARWFCAEERWRGDVVVAVPDEGKRSPDVRVSAPPDLPSWLAHFTETLLKTTARTAWSEGGSWPRRLTRWREQPKKKS